MVQISNTLLVALVLVTPSLAIPLSKEQDLQTRAVEIVARDPSIGSFFRKVKNFFSPSHIDKAANTAKEASKLASMLKREDSSDLPERSFYVDDMEEFTARDFEDFEALAARDPRFGSFFRKIKHFANFNNLKKVASVASLVVREDDAEEFTARDLEVLEELAARDPSFGSFFRKVKHFANFKNLKKVASVASMVIRDDDELFGRDYFDLGLDELD